MSSRGIPSACVNSAAACIKLAMRSFASAFSFLSMSISFVCATQSVLSIFGTLGEVAPLPLRIFFRADRVFRLYLQDWDFHTCKACCEWSDDPLLKCCSRLD